jgi:HKD family nuclease
MLFNQPLAVRFGTELITAISDPKWTSFDFAVAWVRRSGMKHIESELRSFLKRGGTLCAIVGLDLENTSQQGLESLLDLEHYGAASTYVFHNENSGSTFHPKLYLLRNDVEAQLIVGSNNLTEAGLFRNVEAGLTLTLKSNNTTVTQTLLAMKTWSDTTSGLAKRLNATSLQEFVDQGYAPDEVALAQQRTAKRSTQATTRIKLFGSRNYSAPSVPATLSPSTTSRIASKSSTAGAIKKRSIVGSATGRVLLMRLRKASVTNRPTQTQIPIRLFKTGFFGTGTQVLSAHSNQRHSIHRASARGSINTLKFEIPEMRNFNDPVARFEQVGSDLVYETYDSSTPQGRQIMAALQTGRSKGQTELSLPSQPAISTWWRFI